MQSNFKRNNERRNAGAIMSRVGGRVTRFEYVNRAGEQVNPKNGKPYARPSIVNLTKGNSSPKPKDKRHNRPLPIKKSGAIFGGLEPIPTDPTRDPPPRVCFNCWQPGHSRRNCTRPIVHRICNNCGRRGEDLLTCPRCKLAHQCYLQKLQLREGSVPETFNDTDFAYPSMEEEVEDADTSDCDDVLRELIYRDQHARDMALLHEQRELRERQSMYEEQKEFEEVDSRPVPYDPITLGEVFDYEDRRDSEKRDRGELEQRERQAISVPYCPITAREVLQYEEQKNAEERALQERSLYRERQLVRENDMELYQERERSYRERYTRPLSPPERRPSDFQDQPATYIKRSAPEVVTSSSDTHGDPVHEILKLAKSIAHLTPETQDLIMRQVMDERKEKARLRSMQERDSDVWP